MSLDLDFDDGQLAIADAVASFCADVHGLAAARMRGSDFPRESWRQLGALGVLAAGSQAGEGGALEVVAAVESLGRAAFPGPLAETYLAAQVLEGELLARVTAGEAIVSVGSPPLMPWAPVADCFLEIVGDAVHAAEPGPAGAGGRGIEEVAMLGGEGWGRVALVRGPALAGAERGLALGGIARAAYLAAAGRRLVEDAAAHAGARSQFGRPIGDFQAVAHPLADAAMRLDAAATLARSAAWRFDAGDLADARHHAAAARLSADVAALEAAYVGHQVFGALGITLEGPVFHLSRRIRQLASAPGGDPARAELLAHVFAAPAPAGALAR